MTHALINNNTWIDRFFEDFDRGDSASRAAFVPVIDIGEDKDAFLVQAELPGVAKENITVEVKDNRLVLNGRKDAVTKGEDHQVRYVESRHGEFSRVFELPRNVKSEAIEAEFKDGLLTLRIPKADEAKPKTVLIR